MQQGELCMRFAILAAVAALSVAVSPAFATDVDPLDRYDIIELVSEQTVECRRQKDQSLCSNWFSEQGVVKRIMHDDGERRDGRWFVDDQDRLCILWEAKLKPLCFLVYEEPDGSYRLFKGEKHITTILGVESGNSRGL
mgnify:CR=1 FL=1